MFWIFANLQNSLENSDMPNTERAMKLELGHILFELVFFENGKRRGQNDPPSKIFSKESAEAAIDANNRQSLELSKDFPKKIFVTKTLMKFQIWAIS